MPQFATYGTEPQTSAITVAPKRSRPYRASGFALRTGGGQAVPAPRRIGTIHAVMQWRT